MSWIRLPSHLRVQLVASQGELSLLCSLCICVTFSTITRVSPLPAKQKGRKVLKASVSFNHGRQLDSTPATPSSPVPPVQLPSSTNNPIPPKTKRSRQHSKPLHSAKQLIASPHGRQPIPPPLPSKLVPRNPEVVPQLDPTPSMRPPPPSMGPPPPPTEPTPPIQNPRPLTTTSSLTGPPRVKPPPLRPPLQEPATQQSKLDAEKIISRAQSSKAFPPAPSIAPCSYSHSYTEPLQVEYDNIAASKR